MAKLLGTYANLEAEELRFPTWKNYLIERLEIDFPSIYNG
jgi:hypothetical protein